MLGSVFRVSATLLFWRSVPLISILLFSDIERRERIQHCIAYYNIVQCKFYTLREAQMFDCCARQIGCSTACYCLLTRNLHAHQNGSLLIYRYLFFFSSSFFAQHTNVILWHTKFGVNCQHRCVCSGPAFIPWNTWLYNIYTADLILIDIILKGYKSGNNSLKQTHCSTIMKF